MFKKISQRVVNEVKITNVVKGPPKKTTKEKLKEWMHDKVINFCQVTSLHGYIHTVNKNYHWIERWIWILVTFTALIAAIGLLWISWNWNAETPTTTVIESTNYATFNLPFPSVTICTMNRISMEAAVRIAASMQRPQNMTAKELALKFKLLLHFRGVGNASDAEYQELNDILLINNENVDYLLEKLAPECDDIIQRCNWKGNLWRCDDLFQKTNSSEGMCCSFNNYAFKKSNYDAKRLASIPKQPRRVTACGYQTGLQVLLNTFSKDYHSTDSATRGFKVFIHHSYDFSDANAVVRTIPEGTSAYISILPESTYSTSDVYRLPQDERNCVANNEILMNTMLHYSYSNCMAECRANIINELCGCVPFNLPTNGTMNSCKMSQLRCVQKSLRLFTGSVISKESINETSTEKALLDMKKKCACSPDCTFYNYPSELSTIDFVRKYSFNSLSFFKGINITDQSLLHIFFSDLIATHYRKDMYQNWLGILAAFGGLLGLFLGFSLVTGFELIYFFTIRTLFDKLALKKNAVAAVEEKK